MNDNTNSLKKNNAVDETLKEERKQARLRTICDATGWTETKAKAEMKLAKEMGLSNVQYVKHECWKMSEDEIRSLVEKQNKLKEQRRKRIAKICEATGWDEDKSKSELARAKAMGLKETVYVRNEGWNMTDEEIQALVTKLERKAKLKEQRRKRIAKICEATGWDAEKADAELIRIKALGLKEIHYVRYEAWNMNDEELQNLIKKLERRAKLKEKRQQRIVKICEATGWDEGKADEELTRTKALGLKEIHYVRYEAWSLSDEEIRLLIKKIERNKLIKALRDITGWNKKRAEFIVDKASELEIPSSMYLNAEYWKPIPEAFEHFLNDFDKLVIDGEKQITLQKICNIMDLDVPEKFYGIKDEINNKITTAHRRIQAGSIYFIMYDKVSVKTHLETAMNKGAKVIFIDKARFNKSGLNPDDYPIILMSNKIEKVGEVFSSIRESYDAKVIAVTGTVGKTTTKTFIGEIVSKSFNSFVSGGNLNAHMAVSQHIIDKLDSEKEVYVQEIGAGAINSIRKAGRQLKPHGFVLLNVKEHHLNTYKTYENLFEDKSSIDDYLSDDGVVFANFDDEGIANHTFKHRVVSFGIETEKEVDYRAVNIVQNKEFLEFDVVSNEETIHLKIEIIGKHNAYNALAAFAVSKWLNISNEDIQDRFLDYRSSGIRQNFKNIGGKFLYVDCYNVCEESILATMKASEEFDVDEGCKKIAFLGGENKLGERAAELSKICGEKIAGANVDEIVLFGTELKDQASIDRFGDAYSILEGLKEKNDHRAEIYTDINDITEVIKTKIKVGDFALFKIILWLDAAIAIDKALGTSFAYNYEYYATNCMPLSEGLWRARVHESFGEAELISGQVGDVVHLPDTICGYPLFKTYQGAFKNNQEIKAINLGKSIKNIGVQTFYGCTGITKLYVPANVLVIEDEAFMNCTNLKEVYIEEGVTHIARDAFHGDAELCDIYIPASVGNIEVNAFKGCRKVKIHCMKDSFAEKYAKENHIEYIVE